jgi:hypothetical protein
MCLIIYSPSRSSLLRGIEIIKPLPFNGKGFFFVDKRFGISNLDLVRDMEEIIKLENDYWKCNS